MCLSIRAFGHWTFVKIEQNIKAKIISLAESERFSNVCFHFCLFVIEISQSQSPSESESEHLPSLKWKWGKIEMEMAMRIYFSSVYMSKLSAVKGKQATNKQTNKQNSLPSIKFRFLLSTVFQALALGFFLDCVRDIFRRELNFKVPTSYFSPKKRKNKTQRRTRTRRRHSRVVVSAD